MCHSLRISCAGRSVSNGESKFRGLSGAGLRPRQASSNLIFHDQLEFFFHARHKDDFRPSKLGVHLAK